ncbi:hypothetical protein EP7_002636 [Isosphaeraceae bacterium EP7]
MLRTFMLASVAVALASHATSAEEVESPIYRSWAKAKVGTSVTYREIVITKGVRAESTRRATLAKLTPEKAVIDEETFETVNGKPKVITSITLDYRKGLILLPGMTKEQVENPGKGKKAGLETVKVLGKDYKASWYETEAPTDHGPAVGRTWVSDEVPGKILKSSMKVESADKTVTTELIEIKVP